MTRYPNALPVNKVILIGSPGSGKSTLARQMAVILGLPLYHLDVLYWKPGWTETPSEEWRRLQLDLVSREKWIIDGNYGGTLDIRLNAADTIIFFDISRALCAWRVIQRRLLFAGRQRPDMGAGCEERFDREFIKFLLYVWTFPARRKPGMVKEMAALTGKRIVVLRRRSDIRRYLDALEKEAHAGT